ncbi:FMRFamide-activated amiloride-sensitive sodium channel-like [Biomphalaria glabrata]|uniref:FMRFamide-activated amiloride-sensitive sodium channel-like n=1 Tax=Biomphalaria glabrata TaxID=6526 RepID=A0A9U8EDE1_BIOGL|nr:FMRFamide-activated amiloride-sensitive sodium channel-like [Biomphalaria glabrata]
MTVLHFLYKSATAMEKAQETVSDERAPIQKLYHEFGDMTTLHGMRRAVSSNKCWIRGIWTLLVLVGAGLALYQFISIVREFQTSPVSTVVSIKYQPRLEFPAVTLCNLNPIRLSKASQAIKDLVNGTETLEQQNARLEELLSENSTEEKMLMGHSMEDMLIDCKFNGVSISEILFKKFFFC